MAAPRATRTLLERSHAQGDPLCAPVHAVINVEPRCNSCCAYCESWHSRATAAPLGRWLDVITEIAGLGTREVVLSGGEPTLHAGLPDIIRRIRDEGMRAHLVTNGLRLTPALAHTLIEAGLTGLTLSLDSVDPRTYERIRGVPLERPWRALGVLEGLGRDHLGLYRAINCVISRANLAEVEELVDQAVARRLFIAFQAYTGPAGQEPEWLRPAPEQEPEVQGIVERLIARKRDGAPIATSVDYLRGIPAFLCRRSLPEDFRCHAGCLGVNLDAALRVYACWWMPPVGTLDGRSLSEVWTCPGFRNARGRMARLECPRCWLLCHTDLDATTREDRS
jgi:MoaA/NifB/PqqE/SkfB family radical SAM enzyme